MIGKNYLKNWAILVTTTGLFHERLKMKNIKILEMMLKIRMVEEQIASSYTDQKMRSPTHLWWVKKRTCNIIPVPN